MSEDLGEFLTLFREEADGRLDSMVDKLLTLEAGDGGQAAIDSLFRDAHTIRGGAGMVGLGDLHAYAGAIEEVLEGVRASGDFPIELAKPLLHAVDVMRRQLKSDDEDADAPALLEELERNTRIRVAPEKGGARIVVADDSETILSLVVFALQREGFEPVTATNGADALARIREVRPQLVILDARMPSGDGYEVCRAVRDDPDLERPYVIMLTAGARESDRARAEAAGVDEFIPKPFSPSELRARVREILGV